VVRACPSKRLYILSFAFSQLTTQFVNSLFKLLPSEGGLGVPSHVVFKHKYMSWYNYTTSSHGRHDVLNIYLSPAVRDGTLDSLLDLVTSIMHGTSGPFRATYRVPTNGWGNRRAGKADKLRSAHLSPLSYARQTSYWANTSTLELLKKPGDVALVSTNNCMVLAEIFFRFLMTPTYSTALDTSVEPPPSHTPFSECSKQSHRTRDLTMVSYAQVPTSAAYSKFCF